MLPVALIAEFAIKVPLTVAPVEVTTITFGTLAELIKICASCRIVTLLVPFEIPLTPPAANN